MSDFLSNPETLRTINDGINNTIDAEQEDRISSLPDAILVDILTLIPFKSAAATSVLSRRWSNLWTYIPHLIFDDEENLPWQTRHDNMEFVDTESLERLYTIVNHIIHQLNSPVIKNFRIKIPYPRFDLPMEETPDFSMFFQAWVPLIFARKVECFKIIFPNHYDFYGFPPLILPSLIFESESLEELTLRGSIRVGLPQNGINLPNLRKLYIHGIEFDYDNALELLIQSTPLLEDLRLVLQDYKGDVFKISGHNLKSIIIEKSVDIKLVIDAPVLEEIQFKGFLGRSCTFVKFSSRLSKVKLDVMNFGRARLDYLDNIPSLLDGIYNTKYLHLENGLRLFNALQYLDIVGDVESRFTNLNHLSIDLPKHIWYSNSQEWVVESPIPECIMRKLKKIELWHIGGHNEVKTIKLLKYILSKGVILDMLYVSSVNSPSNCIFDDCNFQSLLEWESEVSKLLFALPRSNPSCEIEYVGEHIRASMTDSSKDDLIAKVVLENHEIGASSQIQ